MTIPENKNEADAGQSEFSAGLGIIARLREWSAWSKSQADDELASLLDSAAAEIERLMSDLDGALDDRRSQYLTPEDRAKHQAALNSAFRNALANVALVTPNARHNRPSEAKVRVDGVVSPHCSDV